MHPFAKRSPDAKSLTILKKRTSPTDTHAFFVPHPDRFYDQINQDSNQPNNQIAWNAFIVGVTILDKSTIEPIADIYHLIVCGEDGPSSGTFHTPSSWSMNLLRYSPQSFSHTDYNVHGLYFSVGTPGSKRTQEITLRMGNSFYQHINKQITSIHNYSRPYGSAETHLSHNPLCVANYKHAGILKNDTITHSREFLRFMVTSPNSSKSDTDAFMFHEKLPFDPLSSSFSEMDKPIAFKTLPSDGCSCWYTTSDRFNNRTSVLMVSRTDSKLSIETKVNSIKQTPAPCSYLFIAAGIITNEGSRSYFIASHAMTICVPKLSEFPHDFIYKWCSWKILFTKDGGLYDPNQNPFPTDSISYQKSFQLHKENIVDPCLNPIYSTSLTLSGGSPSPPTHTPIIFFTEIYFKQSPSTHIHDSFIHSVPNHRHFNTSIIDTIQHLSTNGIHIMEKNQCLLFSPLIEGCEEQIPLIDTHIDCVVDNVPIVLPIEIRGKLFVYKDKQNEPLDDSDIALLKMLILKHLHNTK